VNGRIKNFFDDRGFGFITDDNGRDIFYHVKQVLFEESLLQPGTRVSFVLGPGKIGPAAHVIRLEGDKCLTY
jgi:cold shock CspA family protein